MTVPEPRDGSRTEPGLTLPAPRQVLEGERVLRVNWLPGSDRLRGLCHCGAEAEASDPVEMWEWLLAHPDHPAGGPVEPSVTGPLLSLITISEPTRIRRTPDAVSC
ncbi:hypothetical protein [Modestobacter marinus]|uniref:hypothetical protein n=1 Tax=Modestobacter marinus TaxID=477641 RepID=UPI00201ABE24|nr:hypothetical protein [Modestobacter marinus]